LGQGDDPERVKGGCYNINISACRIRSSASALKLGTASWGGFRKIHASDLTIYNTFRTAISLESVDGGVLDDVLVENVVATNTGGAIFIRLGHRNTNGPVGQLRNVNIRNVKVQIPSGKPDVGYAIEGPAPQWPHNVFPSSIVGLPGYYVQNVRLENIEITEPGGGNAKVACIPVNKLESVPEQADKYPEFSMFRELPAWGFYVRHAEGIQFVNVRLTRQAPDYRPALVFDDVQNVNIAGLAIEPGTDTLEAVLQNVRNAVFQQGAVSNISRKQVQFNGDCEGVVGLQ
jgi:polygalacturonase